MKKIHSPFDIVEKERTSETDKFHLDRIDKKILNYLQENNQITNVDLAEKVGISPPPCFRRVKAQRI